MEHRCVLCGSSNPELTYSSFKPSSNFTSFDLLGAGDSLCAECEKFFKDQNYRRKSWVWSLGKTQFVKPKDILPFLLEPPDPPFYIYLTTSGQKQTYLRLFRKGPNLNKRGFWLGEESIGLLHVRPDVAKEFELFARDALDKLGQKKWKLLRGGLVGDWRQREICERIELLKGDPLWQIIVRLI